MNRTVRCLAFFAMALGAWACKGDPQSSLNRGTTTAVVSNPTQIFVDNGATVEVLVEARDALNQATEITSVSEAAGAGISYIRDFLFQPVFDANATDAASCAAIPNSSWTGAGCLVPRTNPTRLRYEITGTGASATSFSVTANNITLQIPVTVTPLVVPVTPTATVPSSGGLSIIQLTSGDPANFAFSTDSTNPAHVIDFIGGSNPDGFTLFGLSTDPTGMSVSFVGAGSTGATPTIDGVLFLPVTGLELTLPTDAPVTTAASTFSGNCASATPGVLAAAPASGASETFYDDWRCGSGTQFYTFTAGGTGDHTFTFGWDSDADMDIGVTDIPATQFLCTGFSLANPETPTCTGLTSGTTYGIRLFYYSDTEPLVFYHQISVP